MKRAEEGGSDGAKEGATERGRGEREEGREGGRYTLYSSERTKQHTTRPLPLQHRYYEYCDHD